MWAQKYGHALHHGIVHGVTWVFVDIERVQHKVVWHCLQLSNSEPGYEKLKR